MDFFKSSIDVPENPDDVYIEASLYQGTQKLCDSVYTKNKPFKNDMRFKVEIETF